MKFQTKYSTLYISSELDKIFESIFTENSYSKIFILVDENTKIHCLPKIIKLPQLKTAVIIESESGEINKSIESIQKIWKVLSETGADRSSLLINLGGGLICDMGGFAASTFKRGMHFINIPTTLLSQVDASVGGKTGFNFSGLKNEIGVFSHPKYVIIDSSFNSTLDKRNILSGWAEMLKHALIFNESDWDNLISNDISKTNFKTLNQIIARSVSIKNHFVEKDPNEKDIRKALNLGHTFGHAFESLFMNTENEILHGEAVAHGMICELYLSYRNCKFPESKLQEIVKYILVFFKKLKITDLNFNKITDLINHDKKKEGNKINITLLEDIGKIKINEDCNSEDLIETLNWYKRL